MAVITHILCTGTCNNKKLSSPEKRLNCSFPNYHGDSGLNVKITQIYRPDSPPCLPGGFQIGDRVISALSYESSKGEGKVFPGDCGTVIGPCDNESLTNQSRRLKCTFPHYHGTGGLHVLVTQIYRTGHPPVLSAG